MLEVLVAISQKFYCRKEPWAMQKLFRKKEKKRKKKLRKNAHKSVRDIENNGYFDVRLKKRR